ISSLIFCHMNILPHGGELAALGWWSIGIVVGSPRRSLLYSMAPALLFSTNWPGAVNLCKAYNQYYRPAPASWLQYGFAKPPQFPNDLRRHRTRSRHAPTPPFLHRSIAPGLCNRATQHLLAAGRISSAPFAAPGPAR